MTPKLFTGLSIAAVASLALAAVVHSSADSWSTGVAAGSKLLPTLQRDMPRLATITLRQGAQSLTLERKGETWSLKDRGGYPVQGERVRALLLRLADAELVDRKTRNPERFSLLELEDMTAKDAKTRQLTLAEDKGRPLGDLLIGKRSVEQFGTGKAGTYVRRPGEKETWLVNAEIDVPTAVNQWVDTTIFEAQIAQVKRVEVAIEGTPSFAIDREAGKPANKDSYKLEGGIPEGKKLKSDWTLEDVVNAFARVELEDVRRPVTPPADAKPASIATWEMENGAKIVLRVRSEGDARWTVVEATGAEGDAKTAADAVNARAAGWEFRLPSWKFEQIFKKRDDLIEDVKK
jgi:hypothetical protein